MLRAFVCFAFLAGVVKVRAEYDCKRSHHQCERHLPIRNYGFPGSIEELDRSCPYVLAYFTCLVDYVDECGTNFTPDVELLPDTLSYLRDACDRDSDTHENIKKHLPCLKRHMNNLYDTCRQTSKNALLSYMEDNDLSQDYSFSIHSACYHVTSKLACYIARVEENCERGVKDFLFDAFRRTNYLDSFCDKDNTQKHLEILEALELNRVMKDRIRELIDVQ